MHTSRPKTLTADPQLAAVRRHLGEHGSAIVNAAGLIGGPAAARNVLALLCNLREATNLDRTIKQKLVALHRLLSLDPFGEGDEPDLDLSNLLDPESPEVEEICLLADRFFGLLEDVGALATARDAMAETPSSYLAA